MPYRTDAGWCTAHATEQPNYTSAAGDGLWIGLIIVGVILLGIPLLMYWLIKGAIRHPKVALVVLGIFVTLGLAYGATVVLVMRGMLLANVVSAEHPASHSYGDPTGYNLSWTQLHDNKPVYVEGRDYSPPQAYKEAHMSDSGTVVAVRDGKSLYFWKTDNFMCFRIKRGDNGEWGGWNCMDR